MKAIKFFNVSWWPLVTIVAGVVVLMLAILQFPTVAYSQGLQDTDNDGIPDTWEIAHGFDWISDRY